MEKLPEGINNLIGQGKTIVKVNYNDALDNKTGFHQFEYIVEYK